MASKPGWGSRAVVMDSITARALSAGAEGYEIRTCDILLEDVELLEDGVEELLGVVVDDEDLPARGRLNGADRVQKLCERCDQCLSSTSY
jgi:hypothetical protein